MTQDSMREPHDVSSQKHNSAQGDDGRGDPTSPTPPPDPVPVINPIAKEPPGEPES